MAHYGRSPTIKTLPLQRTQIMNSTNPAIRAHLSHPPIRRTLPCLGPLSATPQWQANSWPERWPGRDDREATGCSCLWWAGTDKGHQILGPNIRKVDSGQESHPPHPAEIANWGLPKCSQNGAAIGWTYHCSPSKLHCQQALPLQCTHCP